MPANVVKTPEDEQRWQEAKKQAAKQGHGGDYAYIMGIFKRMSKKSLRDRLMDLMKGGPYIGPRGGKWADPKHTIPWKQKIFVVKRVKDPKTGKIKEVPVGGRQAPMGKAPGMSYDELTETRARFRRLAKILLTGYENSLSSARPLHSSKDMALRYSEAAATMDAALKSPDKKTLDAADRAKRRVEKLHEKLIPFASPTEILGREDELSALGALPEQQPRDQRAPREAKRDPADPRGGYYRRAPEGQDYFWHPPDAFRGKPPTEEERRKMYVAGKLEMVEETAGEALAEGAGKPYTLENLSPGPRQYVKTLLAAHEALGISSEKEKQRWRSLHSVYLQEKEEDPTRPVAPWAHEAEWLKQFSKPKPEKPRPLSADEHERRARALEDEMMVRTRMGGTWESVLPLKNLAEDHRRTAGALSSKHPGDRAVGEEFSVSMQEREAKILEEMGFKMPPPPLKESAPNLTAEGQRAKSLSGKGYVKKSISDRIRNRLQKAGMAHALMGGKPKPIPKGMKFMGGGKQKTGPVQGHVAKPPAGFTPIPHSKKGGYHKQIGAGKYIYWYPGQGIVTGKHEADAETTPHQEATAKHVMDQIAALEKKGKPTREELEHTQQAIRNAWPKGPQDVPRPIMAHYYRLQRMAGESEEPAKEETPEVKIKRPGEKEPKTVKEVEVEKEAKRVEAKVKKEARAKKREEKRKAARKALITDPKNVPENFNKLPKMERAKLTANWDQVKEDLDANYTKGDYLSHPDMRQAIAEHIDELADAGHIVPANAQRAKGMILTQLKYGEKAGIKKETLAAVLEENVRKLAHQEVESVKRTLGDHGVRHLEVNSHQANRIFDQLEAAGIKVSPMDRFMAGQVMIDHDMGYTVPVIAKGGFKISDKYHPQASAVLVQQQRAKYKKIFGKNYKDFKRHVETHSGSNVDWKNDPVGSAVRLADNTHLFSDKLPEVLFDSNAGVEVMTKIKLASQLIPPTVETVDKEGKVKMKRTAEDKEKFNKLIGGIKGQLAAAVRDRGDLPKSTKAMLAKAVEEIGELTPKFMISRLAGRAPNFQFDKKSGDMKVDIEQSPARQAIGEIFGDDETDKQFIKMLEDYGQDPDSAYTKKPPPPAQVRVGEKGNGVNFVWRRPSGEHPTERRYAQAMKDTKARLTEIQAMKGPARAAAMKQFFGAELAKAMAELARHWELEGSLDHLEKSAMAAMAARTGRDRPSPYSLEDVEPKMSIKERISAAMGKRPKGADWTPIPGGTKGGFRNRVGGRWVYWYPGMSGEGGTEKEAETHQATKEIAHHEKHAKRWQAKYSKRLDQGRTHDAEEALRRRHEHTRRAEQLRRKHEISKTMVSQRGHEYHFSELEAKIRSSKRPPSDPAAVAATVYRRAGGVPSKTSKTSKKLAGQKKARKEAEKALKEEETMKPEEGEDKLSKPKSVLVNKCQVHLEADEALAKSLEDGEFGIGISPRTHASKTMRKSVKAGEGFTEEGADQREAVARDQADTAIIRDDPAGNDGQGGLDSWFTDAQRTQEPMVRTPARVTKSESPPIQVIDDDDPYTRRLHRMDTRDGQANINVAYNRDAKRTE